MNTGADRSFTAARAAAGRKKWRGAARWSCLFAAALGVCQLGASGGETKGGTWTLSVAMPEARQESSVVALGGAIYVIGGYGSDGAPSTLVQVFDAAAKKWTQAAPMPEALHHMGLAALDGKIYAVGGFAKSFRERSPVNSMWRYDPAADRWERRAPLPAPRGALAVEALDGRIYAMGGERLSAPGGPQPYESIAEVTVYDPKTDAWETLPPLHYKRDHLFSAAIGGRIYAVGGRDRPNYMLVHVEEYNPAARSWSERAPMLTGRSGGGAAVAGGRLYVFGGEGNPDSPFGVFNQAEVFDPARNAWTQLAPMPLPRHAFGAAAIGNRIYLPGGSIVQGGRAPGTVAIMDTFEPN
jgi:N-acetylneuraminic acid mutarotase